MHRRHRADVVERRFVVLVDLASRDLATDDLAEDAVVHVPAVSAAKSGAPSARRAAFSAMPDVPSRRASSASTSCGPNPVAGEQHQAMEPQVGHLGGQMRILSPSLAAITVSVASSPIFLRIASLPFANSVAT